MLSEERRLRILELMRSRENGLVSVAELSALFSVSDMTIRRDLEWLEERGLARRVHGGGMLHSIAPDEKPFAERGAESDEEKRAIGQAAAQLVRDGETIILDAGTTTLQIARNLLHHTRLTVITHALPIAETLAQSPQIEIILLGGILKHQELCAVGPLVTRELARFSADKFFLSATGFAPEYGAADPDMRETEVKQAMIRAAAEVILVADSRKWGVRALCQIAPFSAIHKLVTDDGLPADALAALEAAGVAVFTLARMYPDGG